MKLGLSLPRVFHHAPIKPVDNRLLSQEAFPFNSQTPLLSPPLATFLAEVAALRRAVVTVSTLLTNI